MGEDDLDRDASKYSPGTSLRAATPNCIFRSWYGELMHTRVARLLSHLIGTKRIKHFILRLVHVIFVHAYESAWRKFGANR